MIACSIILSFFSCGSQDKEWIDARTIDNNTPILKIAWNADWNSPILDCWFSEKAGLITDDMHWTEGTSESMGRYTYHRFNSSQYTCNYSDRYRGCDDDCFGARISYGIAVRDAERDLLPASQKNSHRYYVLDLSQWEDYKPLYLPFSHQEINRLFAEGQLLVVVDKQKDNLASVNMPSSTTVPDNYSQSVNEPLQEQEVLALCNYIPDHGLRNDAESYLTDSYFRAYSEAEDAPTNPFILGDEEFLFYFVSGQDGEPIFSIKSIEENGDYVTAKVYLQEGYNGVPWSEEKSLHTLQLVRDENNQYTRYRIDDWDNTKQQCFEYINKIRSDYKSRRIERDILRYGGSSSDVEDFRNAVSAFYKKYGEDEKNGLTGSTYKSTTNSSHTTSDYESLIVGKQFSHMSIEPITTKAYRYVLVFKTNGVGNVIFSEVQPYGDKILSKDNTTWEIVEGNKLKVNTLSNDISGGTDYYTIHNTVLGVYLESGDGTRYE